MSQKDNFDSYYKGYQKDTGFWPSGWETWQAATAEQAEQLAIARQRISELEEINQEGIEQAERFGVKNFRQKQRIAELEKDCDILQTNLDAAHTINKNQVQNCETAYKYAFSMRDLVIRLDEEIERLRLALKNLLADTQHKNHVCGEEWCPVAQAYNVLKETQ